MHTRESFWLLKKGEGYVSPAYLLEFMVICTFWPLDADSLKLDNRGFIQFMKLLNYLREWHVLNIAKESFYSIHWRRHRKTLI